MNLRFAALLPKFSVRPVLRSILQNRFTPGQRVTGRIIQALPRENYFVLHTAGMNLIAKTNLSIFVGDRITGEVLRNDDQIELKLVEINGKPTHQNIQIDQSEIIYSRVPLSQSMWGKEAMLEIYPDQQSARQNDGVEDKVEHCRFLFSTKELKNIALDVQWQHKLLSVSAWIELPSLLSFLRDYEEQIKQSLKNEDIEKVETSFMPLVADVSHFRRMWVGDAGLDIRA